MKMVEKKTKNKSPGSFSRLVHVGKLPHEQVLEGTTATQRGVNHYEKLCPVPLSAAL